MSNGPYLDLYDALETSFHGCAARRYGLGQLVVETADPEEDGGAAYLIKVASQGKGIEDTIACTSLDDVEVKLHEMGLRARMEGWWPVPRNVEWGNAFTETDSE